MPLATVCPSVRGDAAADYWTGCPLASTRIDDPDLMELFTVYRQTRFLDGALFAPSAITAAGEEALMVLDAEVHRLREVERDRDRAAAEARRKAAG